MVSQRSAPRFLGKVEKRILSMCVLCSCIHPSHPRSNYSPHNHNHRHAAINDVEPWMSTSYNDMATTNQWPQERHTHSLSLLFIIEQTTQDKSIPCAIRFKNAFSPVLLRRPKLRGNITYCSDRSFGPTSSHPFRLGLRCMNKWERNGRKLTRPISSTTSAHGWCLVSRPAPCTKRSITRARSCTPWR